MGEFVVDFDSLDGWIESGQIHKVIVNTLNLYDELNKNPGLMVNRNFLSELGQYFTDTKEAHKKYATKTIAGTAAYYFLDNNRKFLNSMASSFAELEKKLDKTKGKVDTTEILTVFTQQLKTLKLNKKGSLRKVIKNLRIDLGLKKELLGLFEAKTRKELDQRTRELFKNINRVYACGGDALKATHAALEKLSAAFSSEGFANFTRNREGSLGFWGSVYLFLGLMTIALVVNGAVPQIYQAIQENQLVTVWRIVFIAIVIVLSRFLTAPGSGALDHVERVYSEPQEHRDSTEDSETTTKMACAAGAIVDIETQIMFGWDSDEGE